MPFFLCAAGHNVELDDADTVRECEGRGIVQEDYAARYGQ